MAHHSASFSLTLRVHLDDRPGASPISRARSPTPAACSTRSTWCASTPGYKTRDVSVLATDDEHAQAIVAACEQIDGVEVEHVSDRTFLLHLGGKIEMESKVPVKTRDDLSMAYTPGVARVCRAIAEDPETRLEPDDQAQHGGGRHRRQRGARARRHRAAAAMPVMEGKALLFKEFGGVDAWPICLDTKDTDRIVATVEAIAPGFGGINLEDIAAPRCFEVEERLRASLDIPVFHDDQHGTAVVVLAAFLNALRVVGKRIEDVKVVVTGVGAAGVAVTEDAAGGRRAQRHRCRPARARSTAGGPGLTAVKQRYARDDQPGELHRLAPTRRWPAPTSSSASRSRAP